MTEEAKLIKINDKQYDLNHITEKGLSLIKAIQKTDERIHDLQFDLNNFQIARNKFAAELDAELKNFKEVPSL